MRLEGASKVNNTLTRHLIEIKICLVKVRTSGTTKMPFPIESLHPWALEFGNQDTSKQTNWQSERSQKSELYKWSACVISRCKYNDSKQKAPQTVIATVRWMRRHACRIERPLSADCDVSAHCINLSKTRVPTAHRRAEQSRTFWLLPGNLNFKVVDECVRACLWTCALLCLSSSPKLHFLFDNSEHLLDGFLKRTRPPKPCQISARSVRQARVLSDWLHFELFFSPSLLPATLQHLQPGFQETLT